MPHPGGVENFPAALNHTLLRAATPRRKAECVDSKK